jgi:hypothetical protein
VRFVNVANLREAYQKPSFLALDGRSQTVVFKLISADQPLP